ncbi:uncharacterized protein LOC141588432 [Silene latifolia]|uniref:uncharacterized protein LOC141588432 n=1 Tax=Silene latifolia TaxID=37657 RepID=UPI003D779F6D
MEFDFEGNEGTWRVTGFYGWPSVNDRHLSWELLRMLGAENGDVPWICIGNFNEVLFATKMKGGTRPQWQMNNFREAVDDCGLREVEFDGYEFTYDNGQEEEYNRQSRIDRAIGNEKWFELFPRAKLTHLVREWSDHAPIQLSLNRRTEHEVMGGKLFRFEHIWVGENGCEDAVQRAWNEGTGDLMETIVGCAEALQKWKGISIGKIVWDLRTKRDRLSRLNEDIARLLHQEGLFWRQRSRALWLQEGDRNTKFFHKKAGQRKQKNHIAKLIDDDGNEHVGTMAVSGVAKADYNEEEVLAALGQMNPLKAPAPMNTRQGDDHMALKLDMAKAYDRVEWTFLERVLNRMGFADGWTRNVMKCISSVSFTKKVNGTVTEEFRPSRGLRQGDPLSPYLFILCAEVLLGLIRRAVERGTIRGIRVASGAPEVSHLLFADDSILFVRAREGEAQKVKEILTAYEGIFGQLVNLAKTTVSFSRSTRPDRQLHIANLLGVRIVEG